MKLAACIEWRSTVTASSCSMKCKPTGVRYMPKIPKKFTSRGKCCRPVSQSLGTIPSPIHLNYWSDWAELAFSNHWLNHQWLYTSYHMTWVVPNDQQVQRMENVSDPSWLETKNSVKLCHSSLLSDSTQIKKKKKKGEHTIFKREHSREEMLRYVQRHVKNKTCAGSMTFSSATVRFIRNTLTWLTL